MYYRIWKATNVILILGSILYIWFFRPHDNTLMIVSQFFAQISLVLLILNTNMYFIFLLIRKVKQREMKIQLATFSRYFMKWHIKIAITSTILIILHTWINLFNIVPVIGYDHFKVIMGYISFILLLLTLFAGYLRHKKASGFRKKFHRTIALLFTAMFLIHIFIPI